MDADTLRMLRAVVEATLARPIGLVTLLMFIIGAKAHVLLQRRHPGASSLLFKVMAIGGVGFFLTLFQTYGTISGGYGPAPLPIAGPSAPTRSPVGTAGPASTEVPAPRGTPSSTQSSPSSGDGQVAPTDGQAQEASMSLAWTSEGEVFEEVLTSDHRCPDPSEPDCEGRAVRTTYFVTLRAGGLDRLNGPHLYCVEGPCEASSVHYTRLASDQRSAEASFDVWGAPTRWRLAATRERQVVAVDRNEHP